MLAEIRTACLNVRVCIIFKTHDTKCVSEDGPKRISLCMMLYLLQQKCHFYSDSFLVHTLRECCLENEESLHLTLLLLFVSYLVSHEATSTGNPEILSLVLQHRDFQRGSQRLAGIPELLDELNAVRCSIYFGFLLPNMCCLATFQHCSVIFARKFANSFISHLPVTDT